MNLTLPETMLVLDSPEALFNITMGLAAFKIYCFIFWTFLLQRLRCDKCHH